jgi:uroporphyrinogen decarboxylase
MLAQAAEVLAEAGARPGFVFGLGHGLLPATPPAQVQALVRYVHAFNS